MIWRHRSLLPFWENTLVCLLSAVCVPDRSVDGDVLTKDLSSVPDKTFQNVEADTYYCLSKLLDGIQVRHHHTPALLNTRHECLFQIHVIGTVSWAIADDCRIITHLHSLVFSGRWWDWETWFIVWTVRFAMTMCWKLFYTGGDGLTTLLIAVNIYFSVSVWFGRWSGGASWEAANTICTVCVQVV